MACPAHSSPHSSRVPVTSLCQWIVTVWLGDASAGQGPPPRQCLETRVIKGSWCVTMSSGWGLKGLCRMWLCGALERAGSPSACFERWLQANYLALGTVLTKVRFLLQNSP